MKSHSWKLLETNVMVRISGFNRIKCDIHECEYCKITKAVSASQSNFYRKDYEDDCDLILLESVHEL